MTTGFELDLGNCAEQELGKLQADLVGAARKWAKEEIGAAIAHQFYDPLTALLIYLYEIEQTFERGPNPDAAALSGRGTVANAVREAERLCEILGRMRQDDQAPPDGLAAVVREHDATVVQAPGKRHDGDAQPPPIPALLAQQSLTQREREVLALITAGASNKEGARKLQISCRTFEVHRAHIMNKLRAKNAADLVRTVLTQIK